MFTTVLGELALLAFAQIQPHQDPFGQLAAVVVQQQRRSRLPVAQHNKRVGKRKMLQSPPYTHPGVLSAYSRRFGGSDSRMFSSPVSGSKACPCSPYQSPRHHRAKFKCYIVANLDDQGGTELEDGDDVQSAG